jgi:hypothetical protein
VADAQVGSAFGMPVGVTPMNKFMPEILVKSFCSRLVEVNRQMFGQKMIMR